MNIHIHYDPSIEHHAYWCRAFAQGLEAKGIKFKHIANYQPQPDCDLAVFWSYQKKQIIDVQRAQGKDYLILERGYIKRMKYASASLNGLNNLSEDYAVKLDKVKNDWIIPHSRKNKGGVLVIGQVPNDATLWGENMREWAYSRIKKLQSQNIDVKFRPHPHDPSNYSDCPCPLDVGDILKTFENYRCIITFSSTTGVEAIMNGVIATAEHPCSMIYDLNIKKSPEKWLKWISHRQWSAEEYRSGEFWDYFQDYYNSRK